MNKDHTRSVRSSRPPCDYCGEPAFYDGKSTIGFWANYCEAHWKSESIQRLGLGCGQRIVVEAEVKVTAEPLVGFLVSDLLASMREDRT